MSTSALVEAAWSTVFANAAMQAISSKAHAFDVTQDSEHEIEKLYDASNSINFFTYLVKRSAEFKVTGAILYSFEVEVTYYKEQDTSGAAWTAVRNGLETLFSQVRSEIGTQWDSTVDFWRPQQGAPEISVVTLDDAPCWRGRYVFKGEKQVSS